MNQRPEGVSTVSSSSPAGQEQVPSASPGIAPPEILNAEIRLVRSTADARNATATDQLRSKPGSEDLSINVPIPLFHVPAPWSSRENFVTLAKWKGRVLGVNGSTFRALLFPVIGDQSPKEAEVYVEDILPDERNLIRNGAGFYWSVGYLDRPSGRIKASLLRFIRAPRWRTRDIADAKARADEYADLLGDESS